MTISPYALTTVQAVRLLGGVEPATESTLIEAMIDAASRSIAHYCRRHLVWKQHHQYGLCGANPDGYLLLPEYPVTGVNEVAINPYRGTGVGTPLTPNEYILDHQFGGLLRVGGRWPSQFRAVRVRYSAGFTRFLIEPTRNDILEVELDPGVVTSIVIPPAWYQPHDLATTLQQLLNPPDTPTISVCYDDDDHCFVFARSEGHFTLRFGSGPSACQALARMLGFDTTGDAAGALEYRADEPRFPIPTDLSTSVEFLVSSWCRRRASFALVSETLDRLRYGYHNKSFPPEVTQLIAPYRRIWSACA